jgi:hypothetical protein
MAKYSGPIKAQIVSILDSLKISSVIGTYLFDDLSPNPLTMDFADYPAVVVGLPSQEADYETNRENLRVFEYPMMIVCRPEDYVNSSQGYEDMIDSISDAFDNNPTLSGAAVGGVTAAITRPGPINTGDKTYIVTFVILKAKALVELTF